MKRLLGISVLGMALALAGCGGDSDSSGSNYNENFHFGRLPSCDISNNIITVPSSGFGCKVQTPKLNKGKVFSLTCTGGLTPTVNLPSKFVIKTLSNGDINSIKNDIEQNNHYAYICVNKISHLS